MAAVYEILFKTKSRFGISGVAEENEVSRKGFVVDRETMAVLSPEINIYSFLGHNPYVEDLTEEDKERRFRINDGMIEKIDT